RAEQAMRLVPAAFLIAIMWAQQPASELDAVRAEPMPEKRYWKALEYASSQMDLARKSYGKGDVETYHAALDQVTKAVQLCDETLRATGKNPSKSPKHFKRAELKMREIVRRLQSLEDEVSVDDRAAATKARTRVNEIHDELLFDIMGRRKK